MNIDLLLSAGFTGKPFDVSNLLNDPRGISGTEIQLLGHALTLGARGHHVRVFSVFKQECHSDSIEFRQITRYPAASGADVVMAYLDGEPLQFAKAPLKVIFHQLINLPEPTGMNFTDLNLSPSAAHIEIMRARYQTDKPWHVLPNACDVCGIYPRQPVPGRLLFHTSADRGLRWLLKALPRIRERVANAHVVVCSDLGYLQHYRKYKPFEAPIDDLCAELERNKEHVTLMGRVSKRVALQEVAKAAVFAYPSDPLAPCEVSPVSVQECLATGTPVVLSPSSRIDELYGDAVVRVPSPPGAHLDEFIEAVVRVLTDPEYTRAFVARGLAWSAAARFERTTTRLEELLQLR